MTTIDSNELYEVLAETSAEQNIMLAGKHFFLCLLFFKLSEFLISLYC